MAVAEVGCWDGDSAVEWVPIVHAHLGRSILVDHFHGNPTAVGPHAFCATRRHDIALRLSERLRGFRGVEIIEGDSAQCAERVQDGSLDVCFIDADHRYSPFCRDLDAWVPKVRHGGILCGHDCEQLAFDNRYLDRDYVGGVHHGVCKAIAERFPNVILIGDTCWKVQL